MYICICAYIHINTQISDEGAGVLFSVLARCDNVCVREVDLQWNRIRDSSHMVYIYIHI